MQCGLYLRSHLTKDMFLWHQNGVRRCLASASGLRRSHENKYFIERCVGGCKSKDFWPTVKPFSTNKGNQKQKFIKHYGYYVIVNALLLYGLEVVPLTKAQMDQLSRYHLRTLGHLQSLPQRTATAAVYMLLGALITEETVKLAYYMR